MTCQDRTRTGKDRTRTGKDKAVGKDKVVPCQAMLKPHMEVVKARKVGEASLVAEEGGLAMVSCQRRRRRRRGGVAWCQGLAPR